MFNKEKNDQNYLDKHNTEVDGTTLSNVEIGRMLARNSITISERADKLRGEHAFFKDRFGIDVNNVVRNDLIGLSLLQPYGNIKTADSIQNSGRLGPDPNADTSTIWKALGSLGSGIGNTLGSAKSGLQSLVSRENVARAVFGLPHSYLPAVDPYGRIYKDLFGVRPEENLIQYSSTVLENLSNETKMYSAFIKVGMIAQAKGEGLLDKVLKTVKESNTDPEELKKLKKEEIRKANSIIKKYGNSKELNAEARKELEEAKKTIAKLEGKIEESKNELPDIITSFGLTFYVKSALARDFSNSGDGMWKEGRPVPFAHYAYNALARILFNHSGLIRDDYSDICHEYIRRIFKEGASLPFYKFVCTEESIVNDTIQNQVGDSFLKGMIDKSSDISREISFVSGGADSVDIAKSFANNVAGALGANESGGGLTGSIAGMLSSGFSSMADFAKSGAEAVFGKDLVDMVLKGNSLIYPRVWKGSSVERMLSLQMRFYSPYGNFASVFINIITPLTVLLGISLPRQIYPSFISYPFAFSIEVPGLFQSTMAITTNISVKRGGRYDSWTNASLMRGVDITLDVTPLKPLFGFPEEGKDGYTFSSSIYGDSSRKGDMTFANEIRNMTGDFITSDSDFSDAVYGNFKESFSNAVNKFTDTITLGVPANLKANIDSLYNTLAAMSSTNIKP